MIEHLLCKLSRCVALTCGVYVGLFFILGSNVYANHVTLAWDPNPESDLAGYILYWGRSSGNYRDAVDIGNETEYTIYGLNKGQTYYFAATAYDIYDNESDYSNEVAYTVSMTDSDGDDSSGGGGGGSGCFIATASYGSSIEPHVKILREFRDRYLLTNSAGKIFVDLYYTHSPPIAEVIFGHKTLRVIVRWCLLPFVGLSWLMLNLGPIALLGFILFIFSGFIVFKRKLKRR